MYIPLILHHWSSHLCPYPSSESSIHSLICHSFHICPASHPFILPSVIGFHTSGSIATGPNSIFLLLLRTWTGLYLIPLSHIGEQASVGGPGRSSWAVIGRWHPEGSWRRLRVREQQSASVSCTPFVSWGQDTGQYHKNITSIFFKQRCPSENSFTISLVKLNLILTSIEFFLWLSRYLVITYCWASFSFPINSDRSEFNNFWAISI